MILFLLMLSFLNPTTSSEFCFDSSCSIGYQIIRFPFRIENRQLKSCGYPGFDLSCHATGQPILHLPFSGDFSVKYIDYTNQEIMINDPKNCLPKKILSLNLSGSPFGGKYSENYTFFICSVNDHLPYDLELNPIECLSNSSRTVFASSVPIFVDTLSTSCVVMKTVTVPVSSSFSLDLRDDLLLKWGQPDCKKCESDGGRCGLIPNSSHAIQCMNTPYSQPQRNYESGMQSGAIYGICIALGVPSSLCVLGFICCLYARVRSHSTARNSSTEAHWTASSRPTPIMGLDGPTINSYPKFVLGESLRLLEPNDKICPICLSDYQPKEILKSIPNCQHCFHPHCIDEWLRLNASCPVCRNSPIQSPPSNPL